MTPSASKKAAVLQPHAVKPRKDTSAITRRAYLLADQTVEAAATYYADLRPPLDAVSRQAD